MRRILSIAAIFGIVATATGAAAQQQTQVPSVKKVAEQMKAYAAANPRFLSKTSSGSAYFKWIQNPPPEYQKAYFQLTEMNTGKRFLSLKLFRQGSGGGELLVLTDSEMNGTVKEAYKATGRTLADADRAMTTSSDKLKIAVTPEMQTTFNAMLEEISWQLKGN